MAQSGWAKPARVSRLRSSKLAAAMFEDDRGDILTSLWSETPDHSDVEIWGRIWGGRPAILEKVWTPTIRAVKKSRDGR